MAPDTRPLAGLAVLDLSRLLPGPFASLLLADLGAQVDKLEDPRGGDYLRAFPPAAPDGMNAVFHQLNRGKRSLLLDLKTDAGRRAFERLVLRYDVLIESFRPGVMTKLGVGYDQLVNAHPRLVYCSITGYGPDGPLADRAGHDLNYLARAGVLGLTGPVNAPPTPPGAQIADVGGGLHAAVGILAALLARQATGVGRRVDISMTEAAMSFATFGIASSLAGLRLRRGEDLLMGGIAPYGVYETADGGHVTIAALEPKFWRAFCEATGTTVDMRALAPGPHQAALKAELATLFRARSRAEWEQLGARVDCCLEPVLTPSELVADAQHQARRVFAELAGVTQLRTPAAEMQSRAAPTRGRDGDAVLAEAGFSADEIAELRDAGALGR